MGWLWCCWLLWQSSPEDRARAALREALQARIHRLYPPVPLPVSEAEAAAMVTPLAATTVEVVRCDACTSCAATLEGRGVLQRWDALGETALIWEGPPPPETLVWALAVVAGPPRPPQWFAMTVAQRYAWQLGDNRVQVGLRLGPPHRSDPVQQGLRPPDYWTYFAEEHDWCDPYHAQGGECGVQHRRIGTPVTLAISDGSGTLFRWEIDEHLGRLAPAVDAQLLTTGRPTLFGQRPVLARQPGAIALTPTGSLPRVISVRLTCRHE